MSDKDKAWDDYVKMRLEIVETREVFDNAFTLGRLCGLRDALACAPVTEPSFESQRRDSMWCLAVRAKLDEVARNG